MRVRDCLGLSAALVSGALVLSACAHGARPSSPPPPPPPPAGPGVHGEAAAVAPPTKPPRQKGRLIDPACRYCVTDDPGKRQYFDQRRNRYYYFDRTKKAYFWENGEPKA